MKTVLMASVAAWCLSGSPAVAQTSADSAAIRATALDYIEGWYTGDAARMERALHPDLAKRIVFRQNGREQFSHMTAPELIEATGRGGGRQTPVADRQMDVTILDVFKGAASVKVVADQWIDYLHIVRFEGRWVIVNVLWELKAG